MNAKLPLGAVMLLIIGVTAAAYLPVWMTLLFGSLALAALYIFARLNSRFDPLDPRFGSCIPPINSRPRDP
jgi:hypothetical protein